MLATAVQEAKGAFVKNPCRTRENEPKAPEGDPIKPKLKGRASRIWDSLAPICSGMGTMERGDELEFATYCNLQAEYEKDPAAFNSSRLAQKRAYAERFGIAGAGTRAKLSVHQNSSKKAADPADKYFQITRGPSNELRQ